jgi:chloramphenicol 3-O phosphotransferase
MIIFLNGPSSSGKSTISRALQQKHHEPLLAIGIDTFISMMPIKYIGRGELAKKGFEFITTSDDQGKITRVEVGEYAKKVCNTGAEIVSLMAQNGHSLIVDETLFGDEPLQDYLKALKEEAVYFVGIFCPLETLLEHEKSRGNRSPGLAREQINRVHGPTRIYDIELNTSKKSSEICADKILSFIEQNPNPQAFKKLSDKFGI